MIRERIRWFRGQEHSVEEAWTDTATGEPVTKEEFERRWKERELAKHEAALPIVDAIDSFVADLQAVPGFYELLGEKYPTETPYTSENIPDNFSLSTIPTDEGLVYGIAYNGSAQSKRLAVTKISLANKDDSRGYTLAEVIFSVQGSNDKYLDHLVSHQPLPNIGIAERNSDSAHQKGDAILAEARARFSPAA